MIATFLFCSVTQYSHTNDSYKRMKRLKSILGEDEEILQNLYGSWVFVRLTRRKKEGGKFCALSSIVTVAVSGFETVVLWGRVFPGLEPEHLGLSPDLCRGFWGDHPPTIFV